MKLLSHGNEVILASELRYIREHVARLEVMQDGVNQELKALAVILRAISEDLQRVLDRDG